MSFTGSREIASGDCNDIVTSIIKQEIPNNIARAQTEREALEFKHYRFKNSIWNKILSAKDFEKFDENEYFRLLEIYKDKNKDLLASNPVTIEQKLALIEAIQLRFSYFHNLPSIQDEIENLNVYKLKKVQKLFKNLDLSKRITRENLAEFSSDFFLILKGPPLSLLDYFTKNKTVRMNEHMLRVLQEDMLVRGLKGVIERIPEKEKYTTLENASYYVKRVMKFRLWRYFVIPYDLPFIDRVKISDELLEKILLDGLDTHQSELVLELKNQNAIDNYERLRKVYRPVAFGVGFYFYYQKYQKDKEEADDKNNDEAKKKFMDEFAKLAESINAGVAAEKTEEQLKDEQFQRVLASFKNRYHEDPTPEEYQELHAKIYGATKETN
jgi:hypothetical protein